MLEKLISMLKTEAPALCEPIQCHKAADFFFFFFFFFFGPVGYAPDAPQPKGLLC
jgi:hypothetical protein